ncbi:hypothetical protein E1212_09145 [Jiangella ureilytica]|uniref:Uncharacterized protein n=1 Tax=Jiangella ureilytica TaxID=2530374 RepID=A0A4R4RV85_9ACTN|nr:hypothetical protein [Jiangella ureilytica]TDC52463.1 hypothetical protein E1212_09145 [Jiangella ureilytica]
MTDDRRAAVVPFTRDLRVHDHPALAAACAVRIGAGRDQSARTTATNLSQGGGTMTAEDAGW